MKPSLTSSVAVLLASCITCHAAIDNPIPAAYLHSSAAVALAGLGQKCGHSSAVGAVCGAGLCCSIYTGRASICTPRHSTGCIIQGATNVEVVTEDKDATEQVYFHDDKFRVPDQDGDDNYDNADEYNDDEYDDDYDDDQQDDDHDDTGNPDAGPFPPLGDLEALPRPQLGSTPYGQVITSCTVPGTIALTFDDGPWIYTSHLLDLLEREHVRATFFVCGGNMAPDQLTSHGNPQLLRRMFEAGHQIGTHSWAHDHMDTLTWSETFSQMYLNEQAMVGVLGVLPTYFRPPYLEYSQETLSIMEQLGYHVITLDVDTQDWQGDYDAAKQNFLAALGWGSDSKLVLSHDIHQRTVSELVEWMIAKAKEHGYRLVTVGECLDDPSENWYRNPYNGRSWQSQVRRYNNTTVLERRHANVNLAYRSAKATRPVKRSPPLATPNALRVDDVAHVESAGAPAAGSLRMQKSTMGLLLNFAVFFIFF